MDRAFIRSKARECRRLADIATNHEVRDALDKLADELDHAVGANARRQPRPLSPRTLLRRLLVDSH
jgi:hypothetical protein